jgi:hypothetical protein
MSGMASRRASGLGQGGTRCAVYPGKLNLTCFTNPNALTGYAINIYSIDELAWATQTEPHTIPPTQKAAFRFKEILMHAAKLLSLGIEAAKSAGFEVREEVLDGAGGGHCVIHGRKCLLLDMTQSHREQLNDVVDALQAEPELDLSALHPMLATRLQEPLQNAA